MNGPEDFVVGEAAVLEDDELEYFTVAFAEQPGGLDRQVHFQITLDQWTDQDIRLGEDTYCLVDDVGRTVYGEVVKCSLADRALVLEFAPAVSEVLGWPTVLRLYSDHVDDAVIKQVKAGLIRIFDVPHDVPVLED